MAQSFPSTCPCVRGRVPCSQRTRASGAPARAARAAGLGKCLAAASASSSLGSGILGRKTRAAVSAGKGSEVQIQSELTVEIQPEVTVEIQSELTENSPFASLAGSPSDQPSPSSDLGVGESVQEQRKQRRARRGRQGTRTSSEAETLQSASSSDAALPLAAAIPAPGSPAVNGVEQDASASALSSPGEDLPPESTKRASRGRRTKPPPVESESSSADEEIRRTRPPNNRVTQRNALPCPSWEDLMSTIKGKPRTSATQQGLGGAPEGSTDDVLQALTLLGLPNETVAKLMKPSTGLLRHQNLEGLIEKLEVFREYGLSTGQVRSLLKDIPHSFSRDTTTLRQILDFLLDLGVTRCHLGAVLVASRANGLNMDDNLLPKATFLGSLGAGSAGKLIQKAPALLQAKLSRLQGNAQVLRAALREEELIRVLERNPRVLTFPTDDMSAFILFIQGRHQLGSGVLATMLSRVNMFRKTEGDRMDATMDLLESVVGRECVVDVLTREPEVLLRDPKATETTIQNLITLMTSAIVRDLCLSSPRLLRLDWSKIIEPALRYAVEHCGVSYEEAVRAGVFGKSLEGVVKPRVEFLLSQGKVIVPAKQGLAKHCRHPSTAYLSLSTVVSDSLERFQRRFPEYKGR